VYEQFFGLNERPFSTIPQASGFVAVAPLQDGLDALVHCVSQSRGIAVITGSAGMGKTQLCKTLGSLLHQEFKTIFMNAASLQSRRALLQAALFELQVEYVGLSEHEARLQLLDAARRAHSVGQRLILVIDDAQLLHLRLFEELRGLADYAPDGETLIRVVLAGHFELEETLADPSLIQFAQRIGVQICLEPLSLSQSGQFLCERLRQCGAQDVGSILTEEALELICCASDGNLRCLAQLTDMTLLLAFADDQRPASGHMVRAALKDLQELPLHWAPIPEEAAERSVDSPGRDESLRIVDDVQTGSEIEADPAQQETDEFPIPDFLRNNPLPEETTPIQTEEVTSLESPGMGDDLAAGPDEEFAVFEVGAGLSETAEQAPSTIAPGFQSVAPSGPVAPVVPVAVAAQIESLVPAACQEPHMTEFRVVDRYTLLDRVLELPEERRGSVDLSVLDFEFERRPESWSTAADVASPPTEEAELLETVQQIRQEIIKRFPYLSEVGSEDPAEAIDEFAPGEPEKSAVPEVMSYPFTRSGEPPSKKEQQPEPADQERRFGLLFTRLRTRRQQMQASRHDS
jgi:type II secretory pathway predicted ATPase ExeA